MAGMISPKGRSSQRARRGPLALCALAAAALVGGGCPGERTCPRAPSSHFVDPEIVALTPAQRDVELTRIAELLRTSYPHLAEKERRFGVKVEEVVAEQREALHKAVNRYQYMNTVDRILLAFHDGHLTTRGFARPFRNTYRPLGPPRPPKVRPRPRPTPVPVGVGLTLRFVQGQVVVVGVRPGSTAAAAGVRPGDALLLVGDQAALSRLGSTLRWRSWARLGAGLQFAASRVMISRPWYPDTPLPRERVVLERGGRRIHLTLAGGRTPDRLDRAFTYQGARCGAGVLTARTFAGPQKQLWERLQRELAKARGARGVVLDLRGNRGGAQGLARRLVRRLIQREVVAGEYRYLRTPTLAARIPVLATLPPHPTDARWTAWRKDRLRPAPEGLRVPLAVITDELCASSCETVARALAAAPEARLFGRATAGSSGLPVTVELPHSGLRVTLPSWQSRTARGRFVEGYGVPPDEVVPLSRAALAAGRDAPLERALDHLCKKLAPPPASRVHRGQDPTRGSPP